MKFNKAEVALLASQPSHRLLLEGHLGHHDHGDQGHPEDEDDTDDDVDSYARECDDTDGLDFDREDGRNDSLAWFRFQKEGVLFVRERQEGFFKRNESE